jgi:cytochrome P450
MLSGIIRETLRLFPPNSIMVRLTAKGTTLCGQQLPKNCEVVISPFVLHRDPRHFADPNHFDPGRWESLRRSPFCYLPFGLGEKYCIGRDLANYILAFVLARLTAAFEIVLRNDQRIDWKVDVTLLPSTDPMVELRPWSANRVSKYGRLRGPTASLGLIG